MSELHGYITQINALIARKSGVAFAKQLALPLHSGAITQSVKQFVDKIRRIDTISFCENNCVDSSTCGIVAFRLLALISIVDGDLEGGIDFNCITS